MITTISKAVLMAGLSCLPFAAGANVITGTFSGYISHGDYDRTGAVTGNSGSGANEGREVNGTLMIDLATAPVDALANPDQGEYASSLDWVSLSIDGFDFGLPDDQSGYLTEDSVGIFNEGSPDKLTVQDRVSESTSINARVYLRQKLSIYSELLDFLSDDTLEQSITWSDSVSGTVDNNYGLFDYQYLWRDDDLGVLEQADGSVVITSFNLASVAHEVPEPGAALLFLSGMLGLGALQRKKTGPCGPAIDS
ncbi:PEP-CTERM sorting domain-containing protein [Marinobacter sp. TBZ242]|uniref:PEP-CTERM sorting domain-containing protein n=1 Tax=Marinobacter azerbaijanicus TaxID=3050455 RepID=A0ABT7IBH7_9GAMM|nr:PEP-CTERM sorting domain-containing protein [Marinobacter sp. TBZ242]MDL0431507.1 PEP-CTERM sorting domain-containing protein [Marinobacter sp. TBZ242]